MNYSFCNVVFVDRSYIKILLLLHFNDAENWKLKRTHEVVCYFQAEPWMCAWTDWYLRLLSSPTVIWSVHQLFGNQLGMSIQSHYHLCSSDSWKAPFILSLNWTFWKDISLIQASEGTLICFIESDNINAVVHWAGIYSHKMSGVTVSSHCWRFELLNQNPDYIDEDDNVDLQYTCTHKHTQIHTWEIRTVWI